LGKDGDKLRLVADVDRLVHEPARYMILAYLYVVDSADFIFLLSETGLTKGNLSSHMSKLEDAGYIHVKKDFKGKKPHTMLKITKKGRKAFEDYRETMSDLLSPMKLK
jgi:DNA-binding MarR family transcriptional regulator